VDNIDKKNRSNSILGLIKWQSWSILLLFGVAFLWAYLLSSYITPISAENIETRFIILIWLIGITLILAIILRGILIACQMWIDIEHIMVSCTNKEQGEEPSYGLILSLNRLRESMLTFTTKSVSWLIPIEDSVKPQLKRIDLAFISIMESLWSRYYLKNHVSRKIVSVKESKVEGSTNQDLNEKSNVYTMLESWMADLREHLFSSRTWFDTVSIRQATTLKYLVDQWIDDLRKFDREIFEKSEIIVNQHYERKERIFFRTQDSLTGILIAVVAGLISLITNLLTSIIK